MSEKTNVLDAILAAQTKEHPEWAQHGPLKLGELRVVGEQVAVDVVAPVLGVVTALTVWTSKDVAEVFETLQKKGAPIS